VPNFQKFLKLKCQHVDCGWDAVADVYEFMATTVLRRNSDYIYYAHSHLHLTVCLP